MTQENLYIVYWHNPTSRVVVISWGAQLYQVYCPTDSHIDQVVIDFCRRVLYQEVDLESCRLLASSVPMPTPREWAELQALEQQAKPKSETRKEPRKCTTLHNKKKPASSRPSNPDTAEKTNTSSENSST